LCSGWSRFKLEAQVSPLSDKGITVILETEMRFKFDQAKSGALRRDPRRRIGFEEAIELWDLPHCIERSSQEPEQWRAIGWVRATLYTVVFEERNDLDGDHLHLVTLWPSTRPERMLYEERS
jgi:uncharacterized DUF497 family protein